MITSEIYTYLYDISNAYGKCHSPPQRQINITSIIASATSVLPLHSKQYTTMSFGASVQRELNEMNTQLEDFRQELKYLRRQVSVLTRRASTPDPIHKPTNFNSMSNIIGCLRREITRLNQDVRLEHTYEQFSRDDASINRELKSIMGNLLRSKLPSMYGKHSWYYECRSENSQVCEDIITQASEMRDFFVFSETTNMWAIRLLADSKMRTALPDGAGTDRNLATESERNLNTHAEFPRSTSAAQAAPENETLNTEGDRTETTPLQSIREVVSGHVNTISNHANIAPSSTDIAPSNSSLKLSSHFISGGSTQSDELNNNANRLFNSDTPLPSVNSASGRRRTFRIFRRGISRKRSNQWYQWLLSFLVSKWENFDIQCWAGENYKKDKLVADSHHDSHQFLDVITERTRLKKISNGCYSWS